MGGRPAEFTALRPSPGGPPSPGSPGELWAGSWGRAGAITALRPVSTAGPALGVGGTQGLRAAECCGTGVGAWWLLLQGQGWR